MTIKLYGTINSPYVRRARIVARELGAPLEFVSALTPEGQEALKTLTPIGKVPFATFDGEVVFDSHPIVERLMEQHGPGPLRKVSAENKWAESNLMQAIDGIADSGVLLLYGSRFEMPLESPYYDKLRARIQKTAEWLNGQVHGGGFLTPEPRLGIAEIALATTLEWLAFRKPAELKDCPALEELAAAHRERASFAATRPVLD